MTVIYYQKQGAYIENGQPFNSRDDRMAAVTWDKFQL